MTSVSLPEIKKGIDKLACSRCIVFVGVTWRTAVDVDCITAGVVGNSAHIVVIGEWAGVGELWWISVSNQVGIVGGSCYYSCCVVVTCVVRQPVVEKGVYGLTFDHWIADLNAKRKLRRYH